MTAAFDLLTCVRRALAARHAVHEVKMFGGIGFMLDGNLVAAASKRGLLLRVGRDCRDEVLSLSGTRPMVMRGKTMADYVVIDPLALNETNVRAGLDVAQAFVRTLPKKAAGAKFGGAGETRR